VVNPSIVAFSRGIKAILRGAVNCVVKRHRQTDRQAGRQAGRKSY
jgi:hypothetical protein